MENKNLSSLEALVETGDLALEILHPGGLEVTREPDIKVFGRYLSSTSLDTNFTDARAREAGLLEGISVRRLKPGLVGQQE